MKLRVMSQELVRGIDIVKKATQSKLAAYDRNYTLLSGKDNKIILTARDYEICISTQIDGKVIEPGSVVVESQIFQNLMKRLKYENEEIEITVDDNFQITMIIDKLKFTLLGLEEIDYYKFNKDRGKNKIRFNSVQFIKMIEQTIFAVAKDRAILIEVNGDEINMIAIDSFRIAVCKHKHRNTCSFDDTRVMVSKTSLEKIHYILKELHEETFEIIFEKKYIFLQINNTKIEAKLLCNNYIDYQKLISTDYDAKMKISRNKLLQTLDLASVYNDKPNNGVLFNINGNQLKIYFKNDKGKLFNTIEIELEGKSLKITFNEKYIIEPLKLIEEDKIIFKLSKEWNNYGIIELEEDESFKYFVLPMVNR